MKAIINAELVMRDHLIPEAVLFIEDGKIDPSGLISHIMGINEVPENIFAMKVPNGAKKISYNELDIPCIEVAKLSEWADKDPLYKGLYEIVSKTGGKWSVEAEKYLLANAPKISL